jgi:hypothetical protein
MTDQYAGFTSPYYPSFNKPYDSCDCGAPEGCGNETRPALQIETVSRAVRGGGTQQVHVIAPLGKFYQALPFRPFAAWDGSLALSDLSPKTFKPYKPSALPYVCDRNQNIATLCSSNGQCNP